MLRLIDMALPSCWRDQNQNAMPAQRASSHDVGKKPSIAPSRSILSSRPDWLKATTTTNDFCFVCTAPRTHAPLQTSISLTFSASGD
jgi:hypothetical protein